MMIDGRRVLALIPARGGSKGLPGKNVKPLCGKPLMAHSIDAAVGCPYIDRACLSTDSPEIAAVGAKSGALPVIRPPEMAQDSSKVEEAVIHAMEALEKAGERFDILVLLQPTSPLRDAGHLTAALELFVKEEKGCLISLAPTEHPPYKCYVEEPSTGALKPLFGVEMLFGPRQRLPKTYKDAGAIYIVDAARFLKERSFYKEGFTPFMMDAASSVDIDSELDFALAETIIGLRKAKSS